MMQPAPVLRGVPPLYRQHNPAFGEDPGALAAGLHVISDAVSGTFIDKDEMQWITDRSS